MCTSSRWRTLELSMWRIPVLHLGLCGTNLLRNLRLLSSMSACICANLILLQSLSAQTTPSGSYIQSYNDMTTGRLIDVYLEYETVPALRYENQQVTERRFVPEVVQETHKTSQTQYAPYTTYQTRQVNLNAWNPLATPRFAWEYIPVTQYQATNQVVDQPISYTKYVDREFTFTVPKLVELTEQRAKFVHRDRLSGTTLGTPVAIPNQVAGPSSTYQPLPNQYSPAVDPRSSPISPDAAAIAMQQRSSGSTQQIVQNYSSPPPNYLAYLRSKFTSPTPSANTVTPVQLASNQASSIPMTSASWQYPSQQFYPAQPTTALPSANRPIWSQWVGGTRPLFQNSFFRGQSTPLQSYGSQNVTPNSLSGPSPSSQSGYLSPTAFDFRSPIQYQPGFTASRDSVQQGMRPTSLQ